jgi:CheY-like chemotaxis protein
MEQQKAEAQQVLDDLFKEGLLPFKLTVGKFSRDNSTCTVAFYDSRIHHVDFRCQESDSFQNTFRLAVLDRVERMSGPLKKVRGAETSH